MASKLPVFLTELRRRKVYRVAAVYAAVGVAISIAVPDLFGAFGFPSWAAPLVIVVIVVGFPIALVLAWAYEVKPEEPREAEKAPIPAIETLDREHRKSIVVLPFDNMSPDPGDAYFSDGLTEELITNLSHIRSLRVISRSSAMVFKGTQKDVRTIGKELDVQYVLEGSVRKSGENLRITAQLIDAASDEHLWAESYDGVLEDVFGMQEDVSRSIVDALRLRLRPEEQTRLHQPSIGNIHAYESYLKARQEIWAFSEESLGRALVLLRKAHEIVGDNEFLLATEGSVYWQYVNAGLKPAETYGSYLEKADRCAEEALRLNPDSAVGHVLKAQVCQQRTLPHETLYHVHRAIMLDPNNPDALMWAGYLWAASGRERPARAFFDRLLRIDPLTPFTQVMPVWIDFFEGRLAQVGDVWSRYYEGLEPDNPVARWWRAWALALAGRMEEALTVLSDMPQEPTIPSVSIAIFSREAWLGGRSDALAAATEDLETASKWDDLWALALAEGYALIGERERSLDWLERTIRFGFVNEQYLLVYDPFLGSIREEERFRTLMELAGEIRARLQSEIDLFSPGW